LTHEWLQGREHHNRARAQPSENIMVSWYHGILVHRVQNVDQFQT
jgi:hypothetical protein